MNFKCGKWITIAPLKIYFKRFVRMLETKKHWSTQVSIIVNILMQHPITNQQSCLLVSLKLWNTYPSWTELKVTEKVKYTGYFLLQKKFRTLRYLLCILVCVLNYLTWCVNAKTSIGAADSWNCNTCKLNIQTDQCKLCHTE